MNRVQKQIVKDALDELPRLSEFEVSLILSLADYDDDRELSDKQNSILNRICTKLNSE